MLLLLLLKKCPTTMAAAANAVQQQLSKGHTVPFTTDIFLSILRKCLN